MTGQHVFKALSDPTRREILRMLRKRPMPAGEVAEAFTMTKGSLSHHLNILKQADLVRCERRGQFQVYSLNTTVFEQTMATLMELFGPGERKRR
jgi:ArsR family transcriptional regulator, arsenate/arsenite/antimonite-responsive transcriptional repressor